LGVRVVPKLSTTLLAVVLLAGITYLAYDPSVVRSAWHWVRHQLNLDHTKPIGSPNYMPVVPAQ
jgi:hypothetical protein